MLGSMSKGLQLKRSTVKRAPSQKGYKSKGLQSKGLQVKRATSQKVYSQKGYKSKGLQVKRSTVKRATSQKGYKSKGLKKFESRRKSKNHVEHRHLSSWINFTSFYMKFIQFVQKQILEILC